jgi:myo-inositol-1(or 4)-monophosphatase
MSTPTHQQLLNVCIEAARTAGNHALKNIHRREEVTEHFEHDIKLVMDRECQTIAENIVLAHFPDHAILGEEGSIVQNNEIEWVIDPIDGTANYTRDLPAWCCSVAVRENGKTVAGCVFMPLANECFTATIDGQACCNNEPIHVSTTTNLTNATFFTGLTKDIAQSAIDFFGDMAPRVNKIRIIGSAAIDICHVACGRSDGYFEANLYLWDVAAAELIAKRAGAITTNWNGEEPHAIRHLCTTPAIHEDIKTIIKKHF